MPTAKSLSSFCRILAIACAATSLAGCDRKEIAPLSEGSENSAVSPRTAPAEATLEQQTEQTLDPLTNDDVALYLKVMNAAAERWKHPLASDTATLVEARKILFSDHAGHAATPDQAKTIARATLLALDMDQIVAEDMKLDGRAYRGIAEAIEAVVPNPARGESLGGAAEPPERHPSALQDRLSDVNAANKKLLALYRVQIENLLAILRNPANLPR